MSQHRFAVLVAAFALATVPAFAQNDTPAVNKGGQQSPVGMQSTQAPGQPTVASTGDDATAGTHRSRHSMGSRHMGSSHMGSGHMGSRHMAARGEGGRASSADHSADQLNAQSLSTIQQGGMGAPASNAPMGTGGGMSGTGGDAGGPGTPAR